jgi:ATP-binding cassette subfamily C (CFTR/MRP) protein 1
MAHAGEEKDVKELDPVGIAANTTLHDEPVAEDRDSSSEDEVEKALDPEKHAERTTQTRELTQVQTNATGITDITTTTDSPKEKRSRWKRWNPLKRNPPPLPEKRGVSREYTAGVWSRLTWQWVTPIMSVSYIRVH